MSFIYGNKEETSDPCTIYSLKAVPLKAIDKASYLGVIVSKDLTWHKHTAKVVAKGNKTLGFVKRNIKTPS